MSHQKQHRTRIEDLSANENELFELSEQMMMMVGGGDMVGGGYNIEAGTIKIYPCSSTGEVCGGDQDLCTEYVPMCS